MEYIFQGIKTYGEIDVLGTCGGTGTFQCGCYNGDHCERCEEQCTTYCGDKNWCVGALPW